jgi:hydrogenase expression/formation protein HypE
MALDYKNGSIEMAHGSGGRATAELIDSLFLPAFDNSFLQQKNDQALLEINQSHPNQRIVMATDSHVISPLFFPGGDIGSLSVHGTVNDVCMSGATPLYLTASFIIEEGFALADLKRIVESMAAAAKDCGTQIVTGDTKVVERGHGDGIYINTTGIGVLPEGLTMSPANIQVGDKILLSGTLGDHGITILSQRQHMDFTSELTSDSQALNDLVDDMVKVAPNIRCMRDPTRGGLAATLNELSQSAKLSMHLLEECIPVHPAVAACSELLGLDPLYIANEGKLVAICPPEQASQLLATMRAHPKGKDAAIIGEVVKEKQAFVQLKTGFGGKRLVDWRYADPLPRIC